MTNLFSKEALPRRKAIKRMRVADAGESGGYRVIQFRCPHCAYDTGWIHDKKTITENRRGLPCPKCNA